MNKKIILSIAIALLLGLNILFSGLVFGAGMIQSDEDKIVIEFIAERWNLIPFWENSWALNQNQDMLSNELKERYKPEYYEELTERDMLAMYVYDSQENKYVQLINKGKATTEHGLIDYNDVSRYPAMWVLYNKGEDGKWIKDKWIEFDEEDMPSISEFTINSGWNFIWVTPDIVDYKLNQILGDCILEKFAVWKVDSGSQPESEGMWEIQEDNYVLENFGFSGNDIGRVMVLKVSNKCALVVPEPSTPLLPSLPQ